MYGRGGVYNALGVKYSAVNVMLVMALLKSMSYGSANPDMYEKSGVICSMGNTGVNARSVYMYGHVSEVELNEKSNEFL
jgi:hypothetical protein